MLLTNDATARIFNRLRPGGPKHRNVLHQIFDPEDMRSVIRNWEECAIDIVRHLHNQVAVSPTDTRARELLEEVLAYPDVPERWRIREPGSAPQPLMNTVFGNGEFELRFFSAITTFGTPHDVTLDELRIECSFRRMTRRRSFAGQCRAEALRSTGRFPQVGFRMGRRRYCPRHRGCGSARRKRHIDPRYPRTLVYRRRPS